MYGRSGDDAVLAGAGSGGSPDAARARILIVVASRHGSTREIAGILAQTFVADGLSATVCAPDGAHLADADAIVIGSGVYVGRWLKSACRFVERREAELRGRPLWLFSSGPLGEHPESGLDAHQVEWLLSRTGAVEHREFAGRLDFDDLGRIESFAAHRAHAPAGDYRDWDEIREWGHEIARHVTSRAN